MMADQLDWTTNLGVAFTSDRSAVFASIQRLRKKANDVGTLKTTPQQEVETRTTSSGQEVIVIEPANPQVVYVPQYNSTTIYTQAPTTTTVVVESDNSAEVAAAGMIGFTAGIAMGAAFSNPYYYGPYGWHGGGVHVQRCVGRLLRRTRGRARRLDGPPGRHRRGARRSRRETLRNSEPIVRKTGRTTGPTRKDSEPSARKTGRRTARRRRSGAPMRRRNASSGAPIRRPRHNGAAARAVPAPNPAVTARRQTQQVREQSARSSDAFSGYSSGQSERSASQRGGASRGSSARSRGGGGGRRR